jgi:hypothetical protein
MRRTVNNNELYISKLPKIRFVMFSQEKYIDEVIDMLISLVEYFYKVYIPENIVFYSIIIYYYLSSELI